MTRQLSVADGPAFLRLMKHYCIDYTNSHDQAETAAIMEPDYLLRMGPHFVSGRDTAYHAATARQMEQFPGLMLTVHEIWTSGERLMMRFSEHGASRKHGGAACAWGGIGLYEWNGKKLVRNHVEQDYFSRAQQLKCGYPNPVEGPAVAPWDGTPQAPDPAALAVVRKWLEGGLLAQTPGVLCDEAWTGADVGQVLDQNAIEINDLFSCGPHVGFHALQRGPVRADFDPALAGREGELYMAGIVHVAHGKVVSGRIIRNRLDLQRLLSPRAA
jgi:hypothetical protein